MKVVAIIPARSGSKRLPGKNKMLLKGKPLICWTIDVALECEFIDEVIVSTNDLDILKLSEKYENNRLFFRKRPESLAKDDTPMVDVIEYELKKYPKYTIVILLQPTSPLRNYVDIKHCYNYYKIDYNHSVVSGYYEGKEIKLNGAVYIADLDYLKYCKSFIGDRLVHMFLMIKERSIDIDTLEDFKKVEEYLENV